MKKIILAFIMLTLVPSTSYFAFSQNKKQLLSQIAAYEIDFINSKKFDVEKTLLFEAILSVGSEKNQIIRESEKRGFIDFYYESEFEKYTTSVEILGDNKPFDIIITVTLENRSIDYTTNSYTSWIRNYNINQYYISKFKLKIYEKLFGPITYSDELLAKINSFNEKQKKEKNKIIKGIDY